MAVIGRNKLLHNLASSQFISLFGLDYLRIGSRLVLDRFRIVDAELCYVGREIIGSDRPSIASLH